MERVGCGQAHAAKSATYDTVPQERFRTIAGKVQGNRAPDEVSPSAQQASRIAQPAMVAEAAMLHKRSLREDARTVN